MSWHGTVWREFAGETEVKSWGWTEEKEVVQNRQESQPPKIQSRSRRHSNAIANQRAQRRRKEKARKTRLAARKLGSRGWLPGEP